MPTTLTPVRPSAPPPQLLGPSNPSSAPASAPLPFRPTTFSLPRPPYTPPNTPCSPAIFSPCHGEVVFHSRSTRRRPSPTAPVYTAVPTVTTADLFTALDCLNNGILVAWAVRGRPSRSPHLPPLPHLPPAPAPQHAHTRSQTNRHTPNALHIAPHTPTPDPNDTPPSAVQMSKLSVDAKIPRLLWFPAAFAYCAGGGTTRDLVLRGVG